MPAKLLVVQNWGKMAHLLQPKTGTSFALEISYIRLLSVVALHYHRLYQILSLETNFSSVDRQKPPSLVYIPQN